MNAKKKEKAFFCTSGHMFKFADTQVKEDTMFNN